MDISGIGSLTTQDYLKEQETQSSSIVNEVGQGSIFNNTAVDANVNTDTDYTSVYYEKTEAVKSDSSIATQAEEANPFVTSASSQDISNTAETQSSSSTPADYGLSEGGTGEGGNHDAFDNGGVHVVDIDDFNGDGDVDTDGDGKADTDHGDITAEIIGDRSDTADITTEKINVAGEDGNIAFSDLKEELENVEERVDNGEDIDVVNLSIGASVSIDDLKEYTGLDDLTVENINGRETEIQDAMRAKLEDENLNVTEKEFIEDYLGIIDSLNRLEDKGTDVYIAAGNAGADAVNLLAVAENADVVAAVDEDGQLTDYTQVAGADTIGQGHIDFKADHGDNLGKGIDFDFSGKVTAPPGLTGSDGTSWAAPDAAARLISDQQAERNTVSIVSGQQMENSEIAPEHACLGSIKVDGEDRDVFLRGRDVDDPNGTWGQNTDPEYWEAVYNMSEEEIAQELKNGNLNVVVIGRNPDGTLNNDTKETLTYDEAVERGIIEPFAVNNSTEPEDIKTEENTQSPVPINNRNIWHNYYYNRTGNIYPYNPQTDSSQYLSGHALGGFNPMTPNAGGFGSLTTASKSSSDKTDTDLIKQAMFALANAGYVTPGIYNALDKDQKSQIDDKIGPIDWASWHH